MMAAAAESPFSTSTSMPSPAGEADSGPHPGPLNYIFGFLLVGLAWGLTTPFIRRAARSHNPSPHPTLSFPRVQNSKILKLVLGGLFAVVDLLKNPRYAIPLLLNLTGSVWFFLLIGKAELSLTVPIVNTLAFLFTVIGEWWVEKKVISRETGLGMILSLAGIALCVHSKSS
ncbi:Transmembrane protein [Zalerion maritima]|uniref:Transmembrane protein n=1 Tax=Zalerion maritima TaxID=339359 RepID=A0AAD5RPM0_9PEZI|nr:Transmembrane protein [Zalerion maritima]